MIETHDGLRLAGDHHTPPDARARVLLVHGFGEHRQRYRELIGELGEHGFACHTFDLRGHGESGGQRGHVDHFSDYLDDLGRVASLAAGIPGPEPLILVGHSLGGLIAIQAVQHGIWPFAALVVSSPFLASTLPISPAVDKVVQGLGRFLPRLPVPAPISPEQLSRDTGVVNAYQKDRRIVRRLTLSWAAEVARAQEETLARASEVTLPTLFLLGAADEVADPKRGRIVHAALGSADKDLRIYPGLRHEVLNEIERGEVVGDLLAWLEQRFPPA